MPLNEKEIKKLANKKEHQRTDQDWNGIWDARSLAQAEVIKQDQSRLEFAQAWASVISSEEQEEAKAMEKVSNA